MKDVWEENGGCSPPGLTTRAHFSTIRPMDADREQISAEFVKRQGRQRVAIAAAMLLIVVFAVLYALPGWLGPNSKGTIFSAQMVVFAAFIGFTYQNWRCPVCDRYLGTELHRNICGKCRARLH